jgi:hypothetical protein
MSSIDLPMDVESLLKCLRQMMILNTAHIKALARSHAELLALLKETDTNTQLDLLNDEFQKSYREVSAWVLTNYVDIKDLFDIDELLKLRKPGGDDTRKP